MGHRQWSDRSGLQDHRRAAERLRHALGRAWGCGRRCSARPLRQQSEALGRLLEPTLRSCRVKVTQGTDAHPAHTSFIILTMPSNPLRHVFPDSVITGWDFSTSGVKCLAFDTHGNTLAEVRLTTDLWTDGGVTELNIAQLEGQARGSVRAMAAKLRELGKLDRWVAGGISATHHTSGRIDANRVQVRRAICWNDETLDAFHKVGLKRLGGQKRVRELIGGPWAVRYSLSHLVKDEDSLDDADWKRTYRILPHGPLAAGYLTGKFDVISVSAAASTGLMDLRTNQWRHEMLDALASPEHRDLAWSHLPKIIDQFDPIGSLLRPL